MWFASLRVITNDSIVKGEGREGGREEEGREEGGSRREGGRKQRQGKRWNKWMDGWLQFRGSGERED